MTHELPARHRCDVVAVAGHSSDVGTTGHPTRAPRRYLRTGLSFSGEIYEGGYVAMYSGEVLPRNPEKD